MFAKNLKIDIPRFHKVFNKLSFVLMLLFCPWSYQSVKAQSSENFTDLIISIQYQQPAKRTFQIPQYTWGSFGGLSMQTNYLQGLLKLNYDYTFLPSSNYPNFHMHFGSIAYAYKYELPYGFSILPEISLGNSWTRVIDVPSDVNPLESEIFLGTGLVIQKRIGNAFSVGLSGVWRHVYNNPRIDIYLMGVILQYRLVMPKRLTQALK